MFSKPFECQISSQTSSVCRWEAQNCQLWLYILIANHSLGIIDLTIPFILFLKVYIYIVLHINCLVLQKVNEKPCQIPELAQNWRRGKSDLLLLILYISHTKSISWSLFHLHCISWSPVNIFSPVSQNKILNSYNFFTKAFQ